jgi:SOS-response transcriptional repressor LexA
VKDLTQRQQKVLDFIKSSIAERGYPPTLREIGAHMGIRSTNGVNDHLRAIERKGGLTREDMKSRALRPVVVIKEKCAYVPGRCDSGRPEGKCSGDTVEVCEYR